MNIVQIEENVKQLIHKIAQDELNKQDFIYELLLAYGHRSQTIGRVRNGERNLAEDKENTVFWKRQIYFKIAKQHDLHGLIDQMKNEKRTESNKIRFLIVTDFKTLLAVDTKTQDTLDVPFGDLAKKFDFFLPWAGMEKAVYQGENPADVKAAEKLAKLFDEIKADNFNEDDLNNKENLHHLNIFLSRLLFCYFAEDTEIFKDKQFTSAISKSNEDGSDLSALIGRLFKVLNQSDEDREADLPDYLADFPYVNGGLFKDDIQVPKFTRKSRRILIECGAELDWSDINPDIFGSMFQAVVHTEQRSTMGQHYTSVPNIMKVIEPLFLNDLYEELEKNQDSVNKLLKLQRRLGQLKIFDPACGSGNFLIIAYKELRKFEMELLKRVQELELEKTGQFSKPFSVIQVSQFYGIEIDDFAHEVAILSLWLSEHQMNIIFKDELGESLASLPLKQSGHIVCANSLRTNWEKICPKIDGDEIYILGNPPYIGAKKQNQVQREEVLSVFKEAPGVSSLDYIACWFFKAALYIKNYNAECAFVSTNSITQGEQVSLFWPHIFNINICIGFCHQVFKWQNNAKNNAVVAVVIIGLRNDYTNKRKYIYKDLVKKNVVNISPYLTENTNLIIHKRRAPLGKVPPLVYGNQAIDNGYLELSDLEKIEIIEKYPNAKKFIKKLYGGSNLLNNQNRWCIWVAEKDYLEANAIPPFKERFEKVYHFRKNGGQVANSLINIPYRFRYIHEPLNSMIILPKVASERRDYLPVAFVGNDSIALQTLQVIYDSEPYIFGILSSRMHMLWVKAVAGGMKTDIVYSNSLCYNAYPFPLLSDKKKEELTLNVMNILNEREKYSNKSLAELYDPEKMPSSLRLAHKSLDTVVESCYTNKPFSSDEDRLEYLFVLYEKLTS